MSEEIKGYNHNPAQLGIWFDYNGWRFKDVYHVRLKTGEVVKFMYPNGSGWYPDMGCADGTKVYRDADIAQVMLVPDEEIEAAGSFRFVGKARIEYNLELSGGHYIPPLVDVETALGAISQAMANDESYAWSWQCNLAMSHVDAGVDHELANRSAAQLIKRVFSVDITAQSEFVELEAVWAKQLAEKERLMLESGALDGLVAGS